MERAEAKAGAAAASPAQSPAVIPAGAQSRAAAFLAAPSHSVPLQKQLHFNKAWVSCTAPEEQQSTMLWKQATNAVIAKKIWEAQVRTWCSFFSFF